MSYLSATRMEEALAALSRGPVAVIAGGTDWFAGPRDHLTDLPILDVTALPGFRGISQGPEGWRIGAATTWTDIAEADLPPAFDGLRAAAREVGSLQIQNAGTIGGNLCNASPAADGVPPLLTLDAQVELVSPRGVRVLALADFLLGPRRTARQPDELLSAVLVPDPETPLAGFAKLGARRYMVISIVMVAGALRLSEGRLTDARLAVGACSPVARRLPRLEARLRGHPADQPVRVEAGDLDGLAPLTDIRGTDAFRIEAVAEMLSRLLDELIAKGAGA
ncbi:xanthine dehydrogenase [Tabrizicola sp. TH137]|uniref:FAD binding domain-containing protein n=1 Tax=Tabrizicola sp. TH137 TaxID=2067452 RepID=UPI000C7D8EC3|nr:FAD binding domain-containing protein [Tabrizicola sp. TH137]PLL11397.1 xanthine dehydrogenase [Tabrizicola sp. TH137]